MKIILFIVAIVFCVGVITGFAVPAHEAFLCLFLSIGIGCIVAASASYRRYRFWLSDLCFLGAFLCLGGAWALQEKIFQERFITRMRQAGPVIMVRGIVDAPANERKRSFALLRPRCTGKGKASYAVPMPVTVKNHTRTAFRSGESRVFKGKFRLEDDGILPRVLLYAVDSTKEDGRYLDRLYGFFAAGFEHIRVSTQRYLSPASYSFYSAFFFGERDLLSRQLKNAFKNTGTYHILSISGLHIGIFFFFIHGTLKLVRVPYRMRLLCALLMAALYSCVSGFSLPTQRSVIMIAVFVGTHFVARKIHPLQALGIALLVVLMRDPHAVHTLGFWLSFASVFFIIAGFIVIPFKRTPTPLETLLYTSVFAAAATMPLTVKYFNTLPWVGVILNLLIVPLSGLILFTGVLSVCFLAVPFLAQYLFLALDAIIRLSIFLVAEAGSWGALFFHGERLPFTGMVVFYAAAVSWVIHRVLRKEVVG